MIVSITIECHGALLLTIMTEEVVTSSRFRKESRGPIRLKDPVPQGAVTISLSCFSFC